MTLAADSVVAFRCALRFVRIVAGSARQLRIALQEARRYSQAINRVDNLKTVVRRARWCVVERQHEIRERLPGSIRKRPAIIPENRMRKRKAVGFEMTLRAHFHLAICI